MLVYGNNLVLPCQQWDAVLFDLFSNFVYVKYGLEMRSNRLFFLMYSKYLDTWLLGVRTGTEHGDGLGNVLPLVWSRSRSFGLGLCGLDYETKCCCDSVFCDQGRNYEKE